jgi:hypothetical protein
MMIREMESMKTKKTTTKTGMMMISMFQLQREAPSGE